MDGAARNRDDSHVGTYRDLLGSLQKSEQMVLALLESATQAIVSIDSSGRIVLANRRAEEMFGYSRQELVGAKIEILLPEAKRGRHETYRDDYFARPRIRPMGIGVDLSGRRKDGKEFPVEVSLSYIEIPEGFFAIAFVSDISQRKQLEEQLRHAQKMEAVGRLAGGVAHDFNNMLTVIAGYNRMILDEVSPIGPVHEYAEEISQAAERAGSLTNQLLAFSRRQIVKPLVINVNAVVDQTKKMLRHLIGEDIALQFSLSPDAGNIRADPGHVEQAIINLAVNARDALPTGGVLTIETSNIELDEIYAGTHVDVVPGDYVMIAVSDTGIGMDAETKRHIFEPFFTTKETGKGTGLGLATVYGIVKQAGGDVWVYSEPNHGTTFKLYFPRVAQSVTTPQSNHESPAGFNETILVVEDEKAVRDLTVRMLQKLGYSVLIASGPAEAIELSASGSEQISILLTDVVMPNMGGRQLADILLETRPDLKVIYVSGYTEDTVIRHGVLEAGIEFLPKPFSRESLARKIRDVLASGR
jgi:hypothetical protein